MRWSPVPLPSGSYSDTARPFSQQEWVNWMPVKAERPGARSDLIGRDVPGLRPFSVVGTGPIRGAHNAEGTLFIVSGTGLYRISPLGIASSLGTIPGVGRVSMCHNQIAGGNEVVIGTGSLGYVYNTVTDALTQITDEGFPGAKSVRFLGQMIVAVEPFGRFWFHSDLADATSYNTINRYEAEGSPDGILHVEASQGEALVFGKRTIEVWANAVTENASFQRSTVIERGAASGNAIVTLDNSCIFLGDDGILYRLNGYTPVPISTRVWENSIRGEDLSKAFAFTWEDAGHKVVYLTFPSGKTYGFDVAQGEMHRRESYGLNRWRLNTLTRFNRQWIGGDFADGTLWAMDWDYPGKEGCDEIVRICRPPVMHDGGNRVRVHALRVFADVGQPNSVEFDAAISGSLGDGAQGDVENYQYTLEGYVEGDEVSGITVTDGALPAGLSISTTGLVTGTRTTAGEYTFTISGTDRCGNTVTFTDSSVTAPAEIFFWREESGPSAQHCYSVHVSDDIIAIGHDNNALSYSLDRGYNWTIIQPLDVVNPVAGLVKYDGDWYAFGQISGAAKAIGDSFDFAPLTIPFTPTYAYQGAFVIGDYLYAGENSGTTYKMRRFDGSSWTAIDTGVSVFSANSTISSMCAIGDYHLFGTSDGKVLRTLDFVTFAEVLDRSAGGGLATVTSLGTKALAGDQNGNTFESVDDGATWSAGYAGFRLVSANHVHFIGGAGSGNVATSDTGADASWTTRLAPGARNQTVIHVDNGLAVIGTISGLAQIGDVT